MLDVSARKFRNFAVSELERTLLSDLIMLCQSVHRTRSSEAEPSWVKNDFFLDSTQLDLSKTLGTAPRPRK